MAEDSNTFSDSKDMGPRTIRWSRREIFLSNSLLSTMNGKTANMLAPSRKLKSCIGLWPELLEHRIHITLKCRLSLRNTAPFNILVKLMIWLSPHIPLPLNRASSVLSHNRADSGQCKTATSNDSVNHHLETQLQWSVCSNGLSPSSPSTDASTAALSSRCTLTKVSANASACR